jgi:uncharacterized protein YjaZ
MIKHLVLLSAFLFFACSSSTEKKTEEKDQPKNASYKITYLTDHYKDFVKAVRLDYQNKRNIYNEKIVDPFVKGHFKNCEYLDIVDYVYRYFVPDTSGLESAITGILASKDDIDHEIHNSIKKCNAYFSNDSIEFYVQPANIIGSDMLARMGGVSGLTAGKKKIIVTIDPNVKNWQAAIESCVARELLHTYWTRTCFDSTFKWNIGRHMIMEGKADVFRHMLYPTEKSPWTNALDEKGKLDLWTKLKRRLHVSSPVLDTEVMFGSNNFPTWGGFTLGYAIVSDALAKKPDMKMEEWVKMDADKMIEISGWLEK